MHRGANFYQKGDNFLNKGANFFFSFKRGPSICLASTTASTILRKKIVNPWRQLANNPTTKNQQCLSKCWEILAFTRRAVAGLGATSTERLEKSSLFIPGCCQEGDNTKYEPQSLKLSSYNPKALSSTSPVPFISLSKFGCSEERS